MTTHISVPVSDQLYAQLQRLAKQRQLPMEQLLAVHLEETLPDALETSSLQTEIETYLHLHPMLWANHAGQYVAICGGKLVDVDSDKMALWARVRTKFPQQFVLVRQVQADPDPEYRHLSVRLINP